MSSTRGALSMLRSTPAGMPAAGSREVNEIITRLQCDLKEWKSKYHDLEQECVILRSKNQRLQQLYSRAESVNSQLLLTKIADRQRVQRHLSESTKERIRKPNIPSKSSASSCDAATTPGSPTVSDVDTTDNDILKASTEHDVCGQRLLRLAESISLGDTERLHERIRQLEAALQVKSQELNEIMGSMRYQNLTSLRAQCTAQAQLIQALQEEKKHLQSNLSRSPGRSQSQSQSRSRSRSRSRSQRWVPDSESDRGSKEEPPSSGRDPSAQSPGESSTQLIMHSCLPDAQDDHEPKPYLPERYLESSRLVVPSTHTSPCVTGVPSSRISPPDSRGHTIEDSEKLGRVQSAQGYARRLAIMKEENEVLRRALARARQRNDQRSLGEASKTSCPRVAVILDELLQLDTVDLEIGMDTDVEHVTDGYKDDTDDFNTTFQPSESDTSCKLKKSAFVASADRCEIQKGKKSTSTNLDAYAFGRYTTSEVQFHKLSDIASISPSQSTLRQLRSSSSSTFQRPQSAACKQIHSSVMKNRLDSRTRPSSASQTKPDRTLQSAQDYCIEPMPPDLRAKHSSHRSSVHTTIFR